MSAKKPPADDEKEAPPPPRPKPPPADIGKTIDFDEVLPIPPIPPKPRSPESRDPGASSRRGRPTEQRPPAEPSRDVAASRGRAPAETQGQPTDRPAPLAHILDRATEERPVVSAISDVTAAAHSTAALPPASPRSAAPLSKQPTLGMGEDPQRLADPGRPPEAQRPRRPREPRWSRFGGGLSTESSDPGARVDSSALERGTMIGPVRVDSLIRSGRRRGRYSGKDPDGEPVLVEVFEVKRDFDAASFVRAAQAAARLDDPHLVALLDAGVDRGCAFVVFEQPRGRMLEEHVASARPRAERSARIVRDAALALAHANTAALAHGSLGAADVFVDEQGRASVLGLGRPREARRSPDSTTAPEQLRPKGAPADAVADVYALGALLFFLVALEPCVVAPDEATLAAEIRKGPIFLRDATIACPPALEAIAAHALERRPEQRYASAADLALDLERFLSGTAVAARPVTRRARLRARLARKRSVALAGAAGLLALLAVALAVFLPPSHVREARKHIEASDALLATDPRAAAAELDAARRLDPGAPAVLAQLPRVRAALAAEAARARESARKSAAQELVQRAQAARDRAQAERRAAQIAERDRRRLDPTPGAARAEGTAWAAAERKRRRALENAGSASGEEWASLLLASALDPQGESETSFHKLERDRIAELEDAGEPAALSFARAIAGADAPPHASAVSVETVPPGAVVSIERYAVDGPRLVPRPFDPARPEDAPEVSPSLATPLTLRLFPGSYRLRLSAPGFEDVLYPVFVPGEGRDWKARVVLLPKGAREPGWIYVPGGPTFEPDQGWIDSVPSFLVQETELAPKGTRLPIRAVNLERARALASEAGPDARLPGTLELAKAFRGVDGRRFPWGNGFDPTLAGVRRETCPAEAGANAQDVSPYGVHDLAGNLAEWAQAKDGSGLRAGGSFLGVDPRDFELHFRLAEDHDAPGDELGVRLVRPLLR
jgi:hypothetical protein